MGCDLPLLTPPKVPQDTCHYVATTGVLISAGSPNNGDHKATVINIRHHSAWASRSPSYSSGQASYTLTPTPACPGMEDGIWTLPCPSSDCSQLISARSADRDPIWLSEETVTTLETAEREAPRHQATQVPETPPVTDAQCHAGGSAPPSLRSQKLMKSFPEETSPLGPTQL